MTDFVASQAAERPPPHDLLVIGPDRRYLMGLGHIRWISWLPGAEGLPAFAPPVAPPARLKIRAGSPILPLLQAWKPGSLKNRCQEAWRPAWPAWPGLAGLAGLAGWLGWIGRLEL